MSKFYVTTPIFYPNAVPHLGNVYPTVLADALARYHRLMGDETYFLTGTDENTQKFIDAARKVGQEPIEFLNDIVSKFQTTFKNLEISNDQFIRTTDQEKHWPGARALWQKFEAAGDVELREYEGLYCVGHEAFITEKDLVDGLCPDHGAAPQRIKEQNYFFKLSKYGDKIRDEIESGRLEIVPAERKNEVLSFIKQGLEDISFSRPKKSDWPAEVGVPVPSDSSHMMYVWCDALANYATAVGYGRDEATFEKWWPADVHVIGKDILRFHAVFWPAMLMSAGLPLPKKILAHGLILSGGKKMSKSLGNVIDPIALQEKYGAEAVRYYLLRHVSPLSDGDMTLESFHDAYNGNLANGLGNLVARIMKLAEDNLSEPVPIPPSGIFPNEIVDAMESLEPNRAMEYIWQKIKELDERIAVEKPYAVVKDDPAKGKEMITKLAQDLYWIGHYLNPFMPEANVTIRNAVATNKKPDNLFKRID